jgi:hypothetical protein
MKFALPIAAALVTVGIIIHVATRTRRFAYWQAWRAMLKRTRGVPLRTTARGDTQQHFNNVVRPRWNRR